MKQPAFRALLLLVLIGCTAAAHSQTGNKPKQFSQFPDQITCSETMLADIFRNPAGASISISFSPAFSFDGAVVNNIVKYSNLQSAVIRSPYFHNSIFSLSRITNKDNSITYVGRIIHKDFADGYELRQNASGQYQLTKIETDRVMPDCSQQ